MNQGIVEICDIDTRALTRHTRSLGAMRVGISTRELNLDRLCAKVLEQSVMTGADLCGEVSTPEARIVPAVGERCLTVVVVDLGIKGMTPVQTAGRGTEVHALSASMSFEEITAPESDGVPFSNDSGSPTIVDGLVTVLRQVLAVGIPYFGICLGSQLFGRVLGFGTYKLKFGHRGINQPVSDRTTGEVEITLQSHGFAVDAPLDRVVDTEFGQASVSHTGPSNDVVEGPELRRGGKLVASPVQYHPETAVGPHDVNHLLDRFVGLMRNRDAH